MVKSDRIVNVVLVLLAAVLVVLCVMTISEAAESTTIEPRKEYAGGE